MPNFQIKYACPNCGEHQLYYPPVKGEYGYYDTSKYACYSCGKEFAAQQVRALDAAPIESDEE